MAEQRGVKKESILEEKQDRREFLKNLGKKALPAIAFLGLGALGSKLYGSQRVNITKSNQISSCSSECASGCGGACLSGCSGQCEGCGTECSAGCGGVCLSGCSGGSEGSSKGDSDKICLSGNNITCKSQTIS